MEARETQQSLLMHVRQLGLEVAGLKEEGTAPLTEILAHWITAQLVVAAKNAVRDLEGGCLDLKTLCVFNSEVVALRRGDHSAERLKIERERLELNRRNSAGNLEKLFLEWTQTPGKQHLFGARALTPAERVERLCEIFKVKSWPVNSPAVQPKHGGPASE